MSVPEGVAESGGSVDWIVGVVARLKNGGRGGHGCLRRGGEAEAVVEVDELDGRGR